jgi:hypothetical protein
MRKLILLAAGAAMAAAMPALAKPGNGGGHGNGGMHGNGHAYGRADDGLGLGLHTNGRYGVNACPPGLAKKNNGCLPPGQARKSYAVGQRLPRGYNRYTPYGSIPSQYRNLVPYSARSRYIYRGDSVYVVNPRTSLVTRVIDLVGR